MWSVLFTTMVKSGYGSLPVSLNQLGGCLLSSGPLLFFGNWVKTFPETCRSGIKNQSNVYIMLLLSRLDTYCVDVSINMAAECFIKLLKHSESHNLSLISLCWLILVPDFAIDWILLLTELLQQKSVN